MHWPEEHDWAPGHWVRCGYEGGLPCWLKCSIVKSADNRADSLTCILLCWLTTARKEFKPLQLPCTASVLSMDLEQIMSIHEQCGHPGIKRMLYFSKMVDPAVKKANIRILLQSCKACQSVNPVLVQWQKGNLSATNVWNRLGIDITNVGSQLYLTIIDCGPSHFALWWLLHRQETGSKINQLESIFYDRGPPAKILTDNGVAFSSEQFYAYVLCPIPEAVNWYNATLKNGVTPTTVPANLGYANHL